MLDITTKSVIGKALEEHRRVGPGVDEADRRNLEDFYELEMDQNNARARAGVELTLDRLMEMYGTMEEKVRQTSRTGRLEGGDERGGNG